MKFGGDQAHRVAREWARRGHWFHTVWKEEGRPDAMDFSLHLPPEDPEYLEWMSAIDIEDELWDWANEPRHFIPEVRV